MFEYFHRNVFRICIRILVRKQCLHVNTKTFHTYLYFNVNTNTFQKYSKNLDWTWNLIHGKLISEIGIIIESLWVHAKTNNLNEIKSAKAEISKNNYSDNSKNYGTLRTYAITQIRLKAVQKLFLYSYMKIVGISKYTD